MPKIKSDVTVVFGTNRRFELIDVIELEGIEYAVLLPAGKCNILLEVIILAIAGPAERSGTGSYKSVEDERALDRVYASFAQAHGGELNLGVVV
jgi:hypothetical protein